MKHIIYLFLVVGLFSSCFDDKGNYDYTDINEVTISGFSENIYSVISYIDTLRIEPEIEGTLSSNENDFEFAWKIIPENLDFSQVEEGEDFIVGQEKNLSLPITLKAGKYICFYLVKDKASGVTYKHKFELQARTTTSEGWLVLSNNGANDARMDVVMYASEQDIIVARNIWANDDFETGKPLNVQFSYHNYTNGTQTLMVTEKGTYKLDVLDLHAGDDNNFRWDFGVSPDNVQIKASGITHYTQPVYRAVIDDKGDLYVASFGNYGSIYEYPCNQFNGEPIEMAPFLGIHYVYQWPYTFAPFLMYDATNQQFLTLRKDAAYPSEPDFLGETLFSAKTGKDFVHGQSGKGGLTWAILKDPDSNRYYYYAFKFLHDEVFEQVYYGELTGPGLDQATMFACNNQFPYIFYVSNNKVYQFYVNTPDTPAKEVLSFPGEEIKVIKFNAFVAWEAYENWERAREYQLVVGTTVNGKEEDMGIMRLYEVPNLMEPLNLKHQIENLGDIVDITYKERALS